MPSKNEDAKTLADSYQSVDDAAGAFMKAMEVALPLYQKLVEARKKRSELRDAFRRNHMEINK